MSIIRWIAVVAIFACGGGSDGSLPQDASRDDADLGLPDAGVLPSDAAADAGHDLARPDVAQPDAAQPDAGSDALQPDAGPPPLPATREPPACGEPTPLGRAIPGPADDGHDADLAGKALRFERVFHAVSGWGHGANADLGLRDGDARAALQAFADADGWTLEPEPPELVAQFGKVAGLYGGMGIAADAYRYLALRDGGAPCADVERARSFLVADLDFLHLASAITGEPGVIARALARTDLPGAGQLAVVPLFDDEGPLPVEKNNGTWRADQSGSFPDYIWEDSCSRDMYVGWALAYAAVWEAIADDPAFDDAQKQRLRDDAHVLLESLRRVQESGYDLEIRDADGRRTYHGILNENSIDRTYRDGVPNGFNAYMAVGIVGALASVTDHPAHWRYVEEALIGERGLLAMSRDSMLAVDLGVASNYSAYNMAFTAGWLCIRYLRRAADRDLAKEAALVALYARPERPRQPVEQDQALYDLVAVAAGQRAALAKVARILADFPDAPFFSEARENCDAAELESGDCVGVDGTPLPLAAFPGRNGVAVADVPVPMRIRPPSNYFWRSNPYRVNADGNGLGLLPGSDFRFVYWAGRWLALGAE